MEVGIVGRIVGVTVKIVVALALLAVSSVLAFAAWPVGMWVGWRVASGGWVLPELSGDPITLWRAVAGVLVGGATARVGLLLRPMIVEAWRQAGE